MVETVSKVRARDVPGGYKQVASSGSFTLHQPNICNGRPRVLPLQIVAGEIMHSLPSSLPVAERQNHAQDAQTLFLNSKRLQT